jgi:hypothetical protein
MEKSIFYLRFAELQSACSNVLTSFRKQLMDWSPAGSWPGLRVFKSKVAPVLAPKNMALAPAPAFSVQKRVSILSFMP